MLRILSPAVALVCSVFFVSIAAAETIEFDLTIEAGKHDRQSTPVRVELTLPLGFAAESTAKLTGDDHIPAQVAAPRVISAAAGKQSSAPIVVRELHFILPSLKAGESKKLRAAITSPATVLPDASGYVWDDVPGEHVDLTFKEPVLRYMYHKLDKSSPAAREQTFKPFHHVYSPDGSRIVTKGAGGRYTHHRGLFFGFNRISYGPDFSLKCDTWHGKDPAYQEHEEFLDSEEGFVLGRHTLQIAWHGAKGEKFANEQREVGVYNVPGGQMIDFASLLSTVDGPIQLDGDPQHAGFHFRADNEVNDVTAKQTYYLRPDGKGAPGETRNWAPAKGDTQPDPRTVNEPWKAMSFVLGDKRYTALRIDHPDNPGEDRSSERDYGRFGAYFAYEVTKDAPLKVQYRVWLQDGELTADDCLRMHADFTDPPKITVAKVK
jgi:hypothetical protein